MDFYIIVIISNNFTKIFRNLVIYPKLSAIIAQGFVLAISRRTGLGDVITFKFD